MSKGNTFENELLLCIFQNADIPLIGDAAGIQGSAAAGSLYVSLHTSDPAEAGTQTSSEISYTGYARVAVPRTSGGWTVTGNAVTNAAEIAFGAMTAGAGGTATWVGIGTDASGTGKLLYRCAVGTPASGLAISTGITPRIPAGDLDVTED